LERVNETVGSVVHQDGKVHYRYEYNHNNGKTGYLYRSDMLDKGAHGIIFRGYDPVLKTQLAIKTLHRHEDEPSVKQEVDILSIIKHTNVTPLVGTGNIPCMHEGAN